ncbi:MAG: hypothetical protein GC165_17615 [Armatimonadetes bacterium]|nr:hypothetical protein [Armatimonadota bacterium]
MKPLAGKLILITRPKGQAGLLNAPLQELGAEVFSMPAIEIAPLEDTSKLDTALSQLETYDWVVLTSVNGVASVRDRMVTLGIDQSKLSSRRLAVIGPATAAALENDFRAPDAMPEQYVSESIMEVLGDVKGKRFLLARADLARRELPDMLRAEGAIVDEVNAYRIVRASEETVLPDRSPDYITLTSAAAARNTIDTLKEKGHADWLRSANLACIGPITESAVREAGFEPAVIAHEFTIPGLVEAIVEHAQGGVVHV